MPTNRSLAPPDAVSNSQGRSWFHQVIGVTPSRLLVNTALLLAGAAGVFAMRQGNEQAMADLQRAKAQHKLRAEQKAKLCQVDATVVVPGAQRAASRWVGVRAATFSYSCVHPAERAEFDRLTTLLQNMGATDAAWQNALHQRRMLVLRGERTMSEGAI
jgi:hypothetical protein